MKTILFALLALSTVSAWARTITVDVKTGTVVCRYYVENYKRPVGGVTEPSGFGASIFLSPKRNLNNHKVRLADGCVNFERFEIHVNKYWRGDKDLALGNKIARLLESGAVSELNFDIFAGKVADFSVHSRRQNLFIDFKHLEEKQLILDSVR